MQHTTSLSNVGLVFSTPRKLPRAGSLRGRVVVLDLAFASNATKNGFERITLRFIEELGNRLAAWIDHHDHDEHARFLSDSRFILCNKSDHGACPELITPDLRRCIGPVDTIVCHTDFDGIASAAKWLRDGIEPYEGCDSDARAIDTRIGKPSAIADTIDRALRARPHDNALFGLVIRHLANGLADASLWLPVREAADELDEIEAATRTLAQAYCRVPPGVAVIDISKPHPRIDKTLMLLIGQQRENIAMILDRQTINIATSFDSGINLVKLLGLSGGMPTRVSIPSESLPLACHALGVDPTNIEEIIGHSQLESQRGR